MRTSRCTSEPFVLHPRRTDALPSDTSHEMTYLPQAVFNRFLRSGRGFGGFCLGHTTLFFGILRGLGYRCAHSVLSSPRSPLTTLYNLAVLTLPSRA